MNSNTVKTIENLDQLLADATVFYQKLRHYHWNVSGPRFYQYHELFESLYDAWAEAIDEIAERILQLGGVPRHTLADMLAAATISEDPEIPAGEIMLRRTLADLQLLHGEMCVAAEAAEAEADRVTTGLLDGLCTATEKTLWMIGATLAA
ncbi:MAG: DNA starvation/stationary phase protection protein [Acidobacteria bacterium]|nr:DNA starvation/stationary phase protection protein [Acidobacteriota bacterium]